jgi:hypothetical protein
MDACKLSSRRRVAQSAKQRPKAVCEPAAGHGFAAFDQKPLKPKAFLRLLSSVEPDQFISLVSLISSDRGAERDL